MKREKVISKNMRSSPEEQLYEAMALLKNTEESKKFLKDLCTPTEIKAMADRLNVVALIKEGMPYREIYEKTGVSVTTIGRVARYIQLGEGGYNLIYKRLQRLGKKSCKPIDCE